MSTDTDTDTGPTITVSTSIPLRMIANLLCCAFEGGVGYWCRLIGEEAPAEPPEAWKVRMSDTDDTYYSYIHFPVNGGAVLVVENSEGETNDLEEEWDDLEPEEGEDTRTPYAAWLQERGVTVHRLDLAAIQRGCEIMARDYPRHWGNFTAGNEDGDTGDCFVQCCLLGKMVYG